MGILLTVTDGEAYHYKQNENCLKKLHEVRGVHCPSYAITFQMVSEDSSGARNNFSSNFQRHKIATGMATSSQPSLNCNSTSSYFQSISLSSTANQLNGLSSDLSDLAIGDRPPPRKIRRRNALTVQDPHYPLIVPPPNSPVHDPFEDSSRLQALDEIVHRDFSLSEEPSVMCSSEPKRKLASNRRTTELGPCLPGEEREVRQILLHKDLEQFKPEKSLPEFLLRKYVKAVKSSLSNPCSALVPYQPPEKLLSEILNKNEKSTSAADHHGTVGEAVMETDE